MRCFNVRLLAVPTPARRPACARARRVRSRLSRLLGLWALLALPGLLAASAARAMPVAFTDSFMAMTDVSEHASEASVGYSFRRAWAVQAGYLNWTRDHLGRHPQRREITDLHLNHRLVRRNTPTSQLNVYVQAGLGHGRASERSQWDTVAQWGGQIDWETTRLYAAYKGHRYLADSFNHSAHAVLGGVSLYEVDYDQVQPWVVLEAKRISKWSERTELTLLARFIYRSAFVELGVNDHGQPRATLMYVWM